jgi:hypothetical protein
MQDRPPAAEAAVSQPAACWPGRVFQALDQGTTYELFFQCHGLPHPGAVVDLEIEMSSQVYDEPGLGAQREWTAVIRPTCVHVLGLAEMPYFEGPAPQPPSQV